MLIEPQAKIEAFVSRELIFMHDTRGFRVSCILILENKYTKKFSKIHDNTRIALL